ncbi:MAG: hypothetical protein V1645_03700 [archaeon]
MRVTKIRNLVSLPSFLKSVSDGTIDEKVQDFEVNEETLNKLGLTKPEAFFFHSYNPIHLYCRLRDMGMEKLQAKRLVKVYERNIYDGIVKFIGLSKQQENSSMDEKTICLHQAFLRDRPVGDGYGDCSVCLPDMTNNPACRGYYPFKIYNFEKEVQSSL